MHLVSKALKSVIMYARRRIVFQSASTQGQGRPQCQRVSYLVHELHEPDYTRLAIYSVWLALKLRR